MKLCLLTIAALVTTLCGIHADDKREEKTHLKGMELYSWKDKAGDWVFVIMVGTNSCKTEEMVKAAKGHPQWSKWLRQSTTTELLTGCPSWPTP
jgi:hypothetical protein